LLWHSDVRLSVADCGEITFHQLAAGSDLRAIGYDPDSAETLDHVSSRQAFIRPNDEQARLVGEHLYEDTTGLQTEEVDPARAITPARVREIHREQLAKLEAERGDRFGCWGEPDPPGRGLQLPQSVAPQRRLISARPSPLEPSRS
jgi:hypothetical protein